MPARLAEGTQASASVRECPLNILGYDRYVAQGGDWGAFVVDWMGVQELEGLIAIHNSMPGTVPPDIDKATLAGQAPPDDLPADEQKRGRTC